MTKKEFDEIMDEITQSYDLPECPPDIKDSYWNRAKYYDVEEVRKELKFYFEASKKLSEIESKNTPEYNQEKNQFKKEIADLLERLLDKPSGHMILQEMATHFGLEISIDNVSAEEMKDGIRKVKNTYKVEPSEDFKCPDKLTPDILKILKGE